MAADAPTAERRMIMDCNQVCQWNSNAGCVKPYGVQCILANVATTDRKVTNADRIRAMSDEELARHLHCIGWDCHLCAEHKRLDNEPLLRDQRCDGNCFDHCLEWLKQPAEVSENG